MPPAGAVAAGSAVQLDLVALNPGGLEIPFEAPARIEGRLEAGGEAWPVTLEGVASSVPLAVAPGGFAVRQYRLVLPEAVRGRAVVTVALPGAAPLHALLMVEASAVQAATPLDKLAASAPVSSALARTFAGRFMPNQPIYFLYGGGAEQAAKFQFSFDYRLATLHVSEAERPAISSLRIGYTQRSLWDIEADSSPFYDTSYMPEVAVVTELPQPVSPTQWLTWMGVRAGFQHESNGRDGNDSRSMNRAYFRARFILGSLASWYAVMLPEVHGYIGGLENNPRIKDYRGYGRLQLYVGHGEGLALRLNVWAGKDFDHPSYQLDLTYPLQLRWLNLESFLQAQYFDGYGESLRAYDQKSQAVRFGVGLVR
ncbi:MAG TPA: phospholipase A [Opitutaceae bacterium]